MTAVPSDLPEPTQLRASTADRERVAGVLNRAMSDGRITIDELGDRLGIVYGARTLGELEPVTRDLPEHRSLVPVAPALPSTPRPSQVATGSTMAASGSAVAIFSGSERSGEWSVPSRFKAFTLFGGADIDLTRAVFLSNEVTITAVAIMGGIDITVPDDAVVQVDGSGIMGGFDGAVPPPDGTPTIFIHVRGAAIFGGVDVHRMTPKQRKKLDKAERKRLGSG